MEAKEMLTYVDHTQLKAFATWEDIKKLCEDSIEFHRPVILSAYMTPTAIRSISARWSAFRSATA